MKIGVLSRTSARFAPGGTVTRLLLLFLFTVDMNAELFSILVDVPKAHDVDGDIALAQLFANSSQLCLLCLNGRSDEEHDAHPLVLVLTMFQCKMCNLLIDRDEMKRL